MTYPLDSDLTDGWCYLPFEQLGPVLQGKNLLVTLKQAKWALIRLRPKQATKPFDTLQNKTTRFVKVLHYSFKIFPQFLLVKSTRILHHNQLLMTKFGKILCLTRKWRQKCSPLLVKASLPRRPGDEVELFGCEKKMADISLVSKELQLELGEIIAKNMANTARRQLWGRHLLFGEYLRSWTNQNVHYRRWT